jgi:divalent metal cation (Fe/Co/Zn/Cd) transporter
MSTVPAQTAMVRKGIFVEVVSILWMIIEAVVAIVAGLAAHSLALAAFGLDSVIELAAGGVLLWRLLLEARGADVGRIRHAENVSSRVVGMALLLLAVYIAIEALVHGWNHSRVEASVPGIVLALASGILMPWLARAKKRIGAAIGSAALIADGACSMVCAWMAWILLLGVLLTAAFGWWWADAAAALGLVVFVGKEGIEAIRKARGGAEP